MDKHFNTHNNFTPLSEQTLEETQGGGSFWDWWDRIFKPDGRGRTLPSQPFLP